MRRLFFSVFFVWFLLQICAGAAPVVHNGYELPVDIYVNDTRLSCAGFLDDTGSVFVPVRVVGTALGANVIWHEETRAAEICLQGTSIFCYADDLSGSSVSSVLKNNSFYVPLRAVAEFFSCGVTWDQETYTVYVEATGVVVPSEVTSPYNAYDMKILASLVWLEAGAEPMNGKIGVASVIFNRVQSSLFPNTVHDVIYDNKYGVQFPPAFSHDLLQMDSALDCILAVRLAEHGECPCANALYFSPASRTSSWAAKNRSYVTTIGKTAFYH